MLGKLVMAIGLVLCGCTGQAKTDSKADSGPAYVCPYGGDKIEPGVASDYPSTAACPVVYDDQKGRGVAWDVVDGGVVTHTGANMELLCYPDAGSHVQVNWPCNTFECNHSRYTQLDLVRDGADWRVVGILYCNGYNCSTTFGLCPTDTTSSTGGTTGSDCRSKGSSCGCSNHAKSVCNSDTCCLWRTGQGCGCY